MAKIDFTDGTYCGDRVDGKRHGNGTFVFVNGDIYSGEWQDDMPNGYGQYIATNWTFTGSFTNGLNAKGVYSDITGVYYKGILKDGKFFAD